MNPSQTIEDTLETETIPRIVAGETFLYESVVRQYNSYLYKIGRSYGFNHSDVEDLMQETYISAFTHLKQFEGRSTFKTWIVKIMLHHCYHKTRKSGFKKEVANQNEIEENSIPMFNYQHTDTGKVVLNQELKQILENAVLHIPEDYRTVFTLRELNGMSVLETSEVLNISEGNVKVRLNRAKSMLRNEITKIYSVEDIFEFNLIYCDKMVERVMSGIRAAITPEAG